MTNTRKIVIGVDFQDLGDAALRAAFALASAAGATSLHAVHVRSPLEGFPVTGGAIGRIDQDLEKLRSYVDGILQSWREEHKDADLLEVTGHVVSGRPATALVRFASAAGAGLIVVGTHGRRGLARAIMGSVAGEVVSQATCPVLVVRAIDHHAEVPIADIEPPCPDCVARQKDSKGAELWCERHAEHHPRAHVYGYNGPSTAAVRPWGF